jgi:hypothetical protein
MKLARAEGGEGPFLPLLANNSLVALADDRFTPSPDDPLAEIRDRFQADTLPLLIQLARLRDDRERFWGTLAEMMMCVAQFSGPAGMLGGHLSYRSHAEGFLSGAAPLRPRFEDFSRELGERTIAGIEAVRDAFAPDGSFHHADPLLETWVKHVRVCKSALDRATSDMSAETLLTHSSVTGDREPGAFEKMIVNGALRELRGNPQFVAYRLMLNNMYGLLPTIGVKPLERFALCFLVAEASEKVFRVNWRKALAGGSVGGWLGRVAGFVMTLVRR